MLDTGDLPAAERAAHTGLASTPDRDVAPLGHFVLADIYAREGHTQQTAREAALGKQLQR